MRKTITAVCITLALMSIAALAANFSQISGEVSQADLTDVAAFADENFSKSADADVKHKISNCNDDAAAGSVAAYVRFISGANFSDEEIEVINRVLDGGTTPQSLAQVYDFWLTTSEPFEIIAQICELEDEYFNEYWYEDAFNALTDNKCGVLDNAAVGEYLDRGVPIDVLMAANVLCRKGIYTIHEILDKYENGESMDDITKEVYGIDFLPEAEGAYEKIEKIFEMQKYSAAEQLDSVSVNMMNDERRLEDAKELFSSRVDELIKTQLEELNLSVPAQFDDEMIDMAADNGFSANIIRTLANKGYTPQEIYLASENVGADLDILAAAKYAREVLGNE